MTGVAPTVDQNCLFAQGVLFIDLVMVVSGIHAMACSWSPPLCRVYQQPEGETCYNGRLRVMLKLMASMVSLNKLDPNSMQGPFSALHLPSSYLRKISALVSRGTVVSKFSWETGSVPPL